jgi:hypothetical protein
MLAALHTISPQVFVSRAGHHELEPDAAIGALAPVD